MEAESFHRQVGVVCVISWSRLLYAVAVAWVIKFLLSDRLHPYVVDRASSRTGMRDCVRFPLQMRFFRRNCDGQSLYAILSGNPRGTIVQHVVNEIPHLRQVCVSKPCQKVISQHLCSTTKGHKSRGG